MFSSRAKEKANQAKEKPTITEYAEKIRQLNYSGFSANKAESSVLEIEPTLKPTNKPYVITPDEFGEIDDYETITLIYYSDEVLTDDDDELVEDVENVVGVDSLSHFGEYEADSVYVRNDILKADYELLLDQRNYSDVINLRPHQR